MYTRHQCSWKCVQTIKQKIKTILQVTTYDKDWSYVKEFGSSFTSEPLKENACG